MREIVDRLYNKRQIELAKSILESAGYEVLKEADSMRDEELAQKLYSIAKEKFPELESKGVSFNKKYKTYEFELSLHVDGSSEVRNSKEFQYLDNISMKDLEDLSQELGNILGSTPKNNVLKGKVLSNSFVSNIKSGNDYVGIQLNDLSGFTSDVSLSFRVYATIYKSDRLRGRANDMYNHIKNLPSWDDDLLDMQNNPANYDMSEQEVKELVEFFGGEKAYIMTSEDEYDYKGDTPYYEIFEPLQYAEFYKGTNTPIESPKGSGYLIKSSVGLIRQEGGYGYSEVKFNETTRQKLLNYIKKNRDYINSFKVSN